MLNMNKTKAEVEIIPIKRWLSSLHRRDLLVLLLLSFAGVTIRSGGMGPGRSWYKLGLPWSFLNIRISHWDPYDPAKCLAYICIAIIILLAIFLLSCPYKLYPFKKMNFVRNFWIVHIFMGVICFIVAWLAIDRLVSTPRIVFFLAHAVDMYVWMCFWFLFSSLLIFAYRKSNVNWFAAMLAGVLHFSYAVFISVSMIWSFAEGIDLVSCLCDDSLFPLQYKLAKTIFPIVSILLYALPLAVIMVLIRKLNWKQKICYLIPGLIVWFWGTDFPCHKYKDYLVEPIGCIHCGHYGFICNMSYYRPVDKSLMKKIESRKKVKKSNDDAEWDK